MPHQVTYDVVATPITQKNAGAREELPAVTDASSGHLRRCSDADNTKECLSRDKDASILSWPTFTGH
eukprot:scaffold9338_cov321-Skeletonema_marinoi.AAC.1